MRSGLADRKYFLVLTMIVLTLFVDSAFFELFSLLTSYMLLEYLVYSSPLSALRVFVVLIIHSSLSFHTINPLHAVIFGIYVFFVVSRNLYLKPMVPFLLYTTAVATLVSAMGTKWFTTVLIAAVSTSFWRLRSERN